MAHKGKPWRLAFRRDFNLNVQTYQGGLPEFWFWQFDQVRFAGPSPLDHTDWILSVAHSPAPDTLRWESVSQVHGGFRFFCRAELQLHGVPTAARWRYSTIDSVL